jgi:hypothetical protein
MRILTTLLAATALAITVHGAEAQDGKAKAQPKPATAKSAAAPKAGKGQKVCRYRFPTGEKRAWVCKKEEPCCAWDAINYVKCGSTTFGCL